MKRKSPGQQITRGVRRKHIAADPSLIQTVTVGIGIHAPHVTDSFTSKEAVTKSIPRSRSSSVVADFTAGRDLHPAPKNPVMNSIGICFGKCNCFGDVSGSVKVHELRFRRFDRLELQHPEDRPAPAVLLHELPVHDGLDLHPLPVLQLRRIRAVAQVSDK